MTPSVALSSQLDAQSSLSNIGLQVPPPTRHLTYSSKLQCRRLTALASCCGESWWPVDWYEVQCALSSSLIPPILDHETSEVGDCDQQDVTIPSSALSSGGNIGGNKLLHTSSTLHH